MLLDRRRGLGGALLAVLLAGCAAEQTGSLVPLASLPASVPRVTGLERSVERDHAHLIASFGGEYHAPAAHRLVSEIAARLVPATERPDESYQVTLLDSPVVNAFALPSGRLYVTRGLLALANDTSEVASVLAHEIAHVSLRHATARSELELRSALVSRVVADVLNDPVAGEMVRDNSRFALASFSRGQELEADQAAVRTLAKAGYDPHGATRFLVSLSRAAGPGSHGAGSSSPDMLATHPSTPERIAQARQAGRRVGAPDLWQAERARYLAAVDGINYGDDPADGLVRARHFIHPRLGIAFEAPEGIAMENTSRAVVGASADGNKRLLFDALASPDEQSLEAVLQSSWNDAVDTGSIETVTVNGRPAAVATSRGKDWTFRLAAMRMGGTTYRLVIAMRPNNPGLENAFRQTLASMRPVTPDEAEAWRPLRLKAVAAGEGDSVETLAGRMQGVDRPLERFLLLNGLERGDALAVGQRYKIVVE
jgi:predicted Zn-dependent protease